MQIRGGECYRKEITSASKDAGCFSVGYLPAAFSSGFEQTNKENSYNL